MPRAGANGIEIEYDEPGSEGDPVILLIMGLSAQLIGWDEDFVAELAGRGFRGKSRSEPSATTAAPVLGLVVASGTGRAGHASPPGG